MDTVRVDDPTTAKWLEARRFEPEAARSLAALGVTPDQATLRTRDGSGGYIDTIGYKVANGDLTYFSPGRCPQHVEPINLRRWRRTPLADQGKQF